MKDEGLVADLEAYLHHLEAVRNVSAHTLRAYAGDLSALVAGLEAQQVERAKDSDLLALRGHLAALKAKGLSPKSIARHVSASRALALCQSPTLPATPRSSLRRRSCLA